MNNLKFIQIDERHFKVLHDKPLQPRIVRRRRLVKQEPFKIQPFLALVTLVICVIWKLTLVVNHPIAIVSPLPHNTAYAEGKISPTTAPIAPTATSTPTPTQTPATAQYSAIHLEIEQVFGKYAPTAFKLLQNPVCHENGGLNPTAVNTNWSTAQPNVVASRDYGVFQINDHWQGVTNVAFLEDYHINIRMAWNIFEHHNYHFDAWTCGRVQGI